MSPIPPPDSPDVHFATNTNPSKPVQATLTRKELSSPSLPPLPFEAKHTRDMTAMTNTSTLSRISAGLSSPTSFSSFADDSFSGGDGYGQNPADILQTRLDAYRGVVKNLQQFFAEVAVVESGVSRAWSKAAAVLVVPFKDGHQFLGKGGLQDVFAGLRDSTKMRAEQHMGAARFVEETVVKHLRRLKQDLKGKIRAIRMDTNLYNNRVFRERELTQEKVGGLARAIGLYEKAGGYRAEENMRSDPYLVNLALKKQLAKQVREENLFARALRQVQEEVATFEARIIKEVKQILTSYATYNRSNVSSTFTQAWAATEAALSSLQDNTEWNEFIDRNGYRLFPSELADADLEELDYPGKYNPYVTPIKTAHLSRKSSVLKNWKDGFFVLTMAGWLHVFISAPEVTGTEAAPDRSIYIPTAVLGQHSEPGQKQHVFSLDAKTKPKESTHSRSTDVGSSTIKRALSTKVNNVAAPFPGGKTSVHEKSPSAEVVTMTAAPAKAPILAPEAEVLVPTTTADFASTKRPHVLERTNTGSTVSLEAGDLATPSILEK
ncbi:hypothetical protein BGZ81_011423 [Podila clonocystis]|nr:hypothetical protein BGZ81_011423 [Podila clonocystis]